MSDSDAVIEVEEVWKKFTLFQMQAGDLRERFAALRSGPSSQPDKELWAVKEVSFAVRPGESLGIVGHNGSGKSTLLKMLTGILKPTKGQIHLRGRVGALIEVGAGFHPDLSGRENIYLNGSILGLSRAEIARKFDDIVSFAGLEKFIDTPVKRYSSGMYMRLGFAVAANTAPNILLIDEVLAVGDAFFQRKCLRHLKEFVRQGGTVVFVSHSMAQVAELCETCLWLDHGALRYHGPTQEAIEHYMAMVLEREEAEFKQRHPEEWARREEERLQEEESQRIQEEMAGLAESERKEREERLRHEAERRDQALRRDPTRSCLLGATIHDAHGRECAAFRAGEEMEVRVSYRVTHPRRNLVVGFEIIRSDSLYLFSASNYQYEHPLPVEAGIGELRFRYSFLSLNQGSYRIRFSLFPEPDHEDWDRRPEHIIENDVTFTVDAGPLAHGCAFLPVVWEGTRHIAPVETPRPLKFPAATEE